MQMYYPTDVLSEPVERPAQSGLAIQATTTYSAHGGHERNVLVLIQQATQSLPGVSSRAGDIAFVLWSL